MTSETSNLLWYAQFRSQTCPFYRYINHLGQQLVNSWKICIVSTAWSSTQLLPSAVFWKMKYDDIIASAMLLFHTQSDLDQAIKQIFISDGDRAWREFHGDGRGSTVPDGGSMVMTGVPRCLAGVPQCLAGVPRCLAEVPWCMAGGGSTVFPRCLTVVPRCLAGVPQ